MVKTQINLYTTMMGHHALKRLICYEIKSGKRIVNVKTNMVTLNI